MHKQTVVACVLVPGADGRPRRAIRRFETMLDELEALAGWLAEQAVTHVALESTGVSRQPVWSVLEAAGRFELLLVNARHVKAVPGRQTDVRDSEWLARCCGTGWCGAAACRTGPGGSCAS